jgi:hypothetical protein
MSFWCNQTGLDQKTELPASVVNHSRVNAPLAATSLLVLLWKHADVRAFLLGDLPDRFMPDPSTIGGPVFKPEAVDEPPMVDECSQPVTLVKILLAISHHPQHPNPPFRAHTRLNIIPLRWFPDSASRKSCTCDDGIEQLPGYLEITCTLQFTNTGRTGDIDLGHEFTDYVDSRE